MNYSLITPTKNEGKYIRQTIESVIKQDILPVEWMIMDDGSTDNSAVIINEYLEKHPFIHYIKLTDFRKELIRTGGRVAAILNYADSLRTNKVDIIVKLDGDTSFEKDYFANMINEFKRDSQLGVASGHVIENGKPVYVKDWKSGRGPCMLLRYDCFLQIGRFFESKTRGEDVLAFVAARAFGWKTGTFEYFFTHLKLTGFSNSPIKTHFETGFYKGAVPHWFPYYSGTLIRDIFLKPYFIGVLANLYGYFLSHIILRYRPFPSYVSKQLQMEQKVNLRKMIGLKVQD